MKYGRAVFALWHQEVFFVAYAFGKAHPDTLASQGDSGAIITRMLELSGYRVFRGGSSSGHQRRSVGIVDEIVEHMRRTPGVIYGITTDGSKGPVYRMKRGAVQIAVETGAPVVVYKTWCKRYLPSADLGPHDRAAAVQPHHVRVRGPVLAEHRAARSSSASTRCTRRSSARSAR